MSKKKKHQPTLRILIGEVTALGPGKAELLESINKTGSIAEAAREMGMSYRRAWNLVDSMNSNFTVKLVETSSGGKGGGGAMVTKLGRDVLRSYRQIERKALSSVEDQLTMFKSYLK